MYNKKTPEPCFFGKIFNPLLQLLCARVEKAVTFIINKISPTSSEFLICTIIFIVLMGPRETFRSGVEPPAAMATKSLWMLCRAEERSLS